MNLTAAQLQTLKRTIAKKLEPAEFDLFLEACRSYGLDPFRKQIIPAIHDPENPDRRKMTLITTRDGLRVIASRQGNYRPPDRPAEFLFHRDDWKPDEESPPNPLKIEACTVRLYQKHDDKWFPVVGQAYWDEYAPKGDAWSYSQWPKMPRTMITKCAEAAALRAGWPDAFGGLYVEEEISNPDAMSPSEKLKAEEEAQRQSLIGQGILFDVDGRKVQKIPVGKVFDTLCEALCNMTDKEVMQFTQRNEEGLREFWAKAPSDALELKRYIEPRIDRVIEREAKLTIKNLSGE